MTFTIIHILLTFVGGLIVGLLLTHLFPNVQSQSSAIPIQPPVREPQTDIQQRPPPELLDDDQTRIQMRPIAIGSKPEPTPVEPVKAITLYTDDTSEEFTEDLPPEHFHTAPVLPNTVELEEITDEIPPEDVLGEDDTLPFRRPEWDKPQN